MSWFWWFAIGCGLVLLEFVWWDYRESAREQEAERRERATRWKP